MREGEPLPLAVRRGLEQAYSVDLGGVRVHADEAAAVAATSLRAEAFTLGRGIWFGRGRYRPDTHAGRRLLAHEVAHTVQQTGRWPAPDAPLQIGAPGDPAERAAVQAAERIAAGGTPATASIRPSLPAPLLQRQDVEFELEVPTPQERERLRQSGVQLPGASAEAADPRRHADYVDNRLEAVGFGIYLGGYVLYLSGLDMPVFLPESHIEFGTQDMAPADLAIFPDYSAAMTHVPLGPHVSGQPIPYTYYRGAGGAIVAPTMFTPTTTPLVVQTAREARRQLAEYVQEQLTAVAIGIVGGALFRGAIRWLARIGRGRGGPPPSRLSPAAERSRALARQKQAQGEPVIANMGGAGAQHEPAGAININNQAVGRRGIPNHVNADASDIGQLFDAGSVDRVVGHHMPPGVINWEQAVPGIRSVLRSGGTFRFDWRGANAEVAHVARLLREAGFEAVETIADTLVIAVKR